MHLYEICFITLINRGVAVLGCSCWAAQVSRVTARGSLSECRVPWISTSEKTIMTILQAVAPVPSRCSWRQSSDNDSHTGGSWWRCLGSSVWLSSLRSASSTAIAGRNVATLTSATDSSSDKSEHSYLVTDSTALFDRFVAPSLLTYWLWAHHDALFWHNYRNSAIRNVLTKVCNIIEAFSFFRASSLLYLVLV